MCLKDVTQNQNMHKHAHTTHPPLHTQLHTPSGTLTLAAFSSSETGVELPVKSSES